MVADPLFARSQRLQRFLEFVVQESVTGRFSNLKEFSVGVEVFERGERFDPQVDPIVRIMAGRLRSRIAEYYQGPGARDPLRIDLPKGGYVAAFARRTSGSDDRTAAGAKRSRPTYFVGRTLEVALLHEALGAARRGHGAVVFVSGDAGVGKTALVDEFVDEVGGGAEPILLLRGRCTERLSAGYPLAPILEALEALTGGADGAWAAPILAAQAPIWSKLVTPSSDAADRAASAPSNLFERMRRELVRVLAALAQRRPVVLFIDDLHWADASTGDILSYLGGHVADTALLVLATVRPGETRGPGHPLPRLRGELERAGLLHDVTLGPLDATQVGLFLNLYFPGHGVPVDFAAAVYERTGGHPLFVSDLSRFLRETGAVVERDGRWAVTTALDDIKRVIPAGALNMIGLALARLSESDRAILQCGAVQGWQFDSAIVTRVLGLDPAVTEERLHELSTVHRFIDPVGERDLHDHTVSMRYQFAHVFYQNALATALPPSRRAALSLNVAQALARSAGDSVSALATDLALLYECGRDNGEAARFFAIAARNASRLFAYPEAVVLAERGLRALAATPSSVERDQQELFLSLTLGMGYMVTKGYATPEAARTHTRSRELCHRLGQKRWLSPVLWGLHTYEINAGRLRTALDLANEMVAVAKDTQSRTAEVESMHALGTTLAFMGRLADARHQLEQILVASPIERPVFRGALYVLDPAVTSLSMLARVLALMGHFPDALERACQSVTLAEQLAHPHSLAYAEFWMGWVHHCRLAPEAARGHLERAVDLSQQHALPQVLEWARFVRGSAWAQTGHSVQGISAMRDSLRAQGQMHCLLERSYCLTLLAEAVLQAGDATEAVGLCDESLAVAHATDALCYHAETLRVRSRSRQALGATTADVVAELSAAITAARDTGAASLELRAAVDLFDLSPDSGIDAIERALQACAPQDESPCVRQARVRLGSTRSA
jgi:tetratricopeptide (TPR) repeat protein